MTARWLGIALVAFACNNVHEGSSKMAPPSTPSAPTAGAPAAGGQVTPWTAFQVPGVELAIERDPVAHRVQGIARVDGAELRGKAAFDKVRPKVGHDAAQLAALAMLFLDDNTAGTLPWTARTGDRVPAQQAIAQPPALAGDTLTYWRFHDRLADMVRVQVALATGHVQPTMAGDLLEQQRVGGDPGAAAAQDLASDDVNTRVHGIRMLGDHKVASARPKLIDLALNAYDFRERQAAVESLGKIGGADVTSTVSRVLLYDQYAEVRQSAATALGELRDPAGKDALQKAAKGDANARVQALASDALHRL
ncbi:MAG TPA: HEAT repeat domain-containing protein [Kofleriaceae bacterium]|nr:HEAT repeat domain-containing protein [Kofleriaceae bacterium]